MILFLASLLFYIWGEGNFVILMLSSVVLNYVFALLIDATRGPRKTRALWFGITANLLALLYFKYSNFLIDNVNLGLALAGLPIIGTGRICGPRRRPPAGRWPACARRWGTRCQPRGDDTRPVRPRCSRLPDPLSSFARRDGAKLATTAVWKRAGVCVGALREVGLVRVAETLDRLAAEDLLLGGHPLRTGRGRGS